jgi:hypothetical protein
MSGTVKALVSADRPLIRIYGADGEYAEIQFETQDDANVAVERFKMRCSQEGNRDSFHEGAVYVTASSPRSRTSAAATFLFSPPNLIQGGLST